jgi:hypothetical protein
MPKDKSVGAALVLTFLFGPLGLLYVTVAGGLILLAAAIVLGILTLGVADIPIWIASMIWGAIGASNRHSEYQAWLVRGAHTTNPTGIPSVPPPPPSIPPPPPSIPLPPSATSFPSGNVSGITPPIPPV